MLEALGDFNKARQCIPSCDAEDTLLHIRLLLHEQSLALAKEMIAQIMPRASFLDEDLRKGLRLFSKDHATWSCVGADDWLKARVWHLETWVIWLEGTQPFSRTFSRKDQLLEAAIAWKRGRKINAIRMLAQLHLIEAVTKTPSPSPSVQDMYAILGRKATTRSRLPADALLDRAYEFLDSNGERGDLRFVTAWNCPLEAVRFIREVSEFASSHSFIRMLLHARDVKEDISVEPKRWLPWIALAVTSAVWIPQLRDLLSAGQLCSELLSTIPGNSSHVWEYTVLASLIILCRFPVRLMEKGIIAWLSGRLFGAICFVQGTVFTSLIAAQIMEKTSKAGKNFSESGWFVMGFFAVWVSGPLIGLWTGWKCNPDVNIRT